MSEAYECLSDDNKRKQVTGVATFLLDMSVKVLFTPPDLATCYEQQISAKGYIIVKRFDTCASNVCFAIYCACVLCYTSLPVLSRPLAMIVLLLLNM